MIVALRARATARVPLHIQAEGYFAVHALECFMRIYRVTASLFIAQRGYEFRVIYGMKSEGRRGATRGEGGEVVEATIPLLSTSGIPCSSPIRRHYRKMRVNGSPVVA